MKSNSIQPGKTYGDINIKTSQTQKNPGVSFNAILENKARDNIKSDVNFSKHAALRLEQRNVSLDSDQMKRISDAINLADKKGIKNSLIIMEEIVLIANIKSRTIVTAIDKGSMKEKVFTNVDGAVNI